VTFELRLPDVGEGVAEGEIVRWLVAEGATVKEDDLLVEVLTDKAEMEIPSPVSGVLARIAATAGQTVKVGEVIALIETEGMSAHPARPGNAVDVPPAQSTDSAPHGYPSHGVDALATPAVRKIAKDLGVDLSGLTGTGPAGRMSEEDVRRAARSSATAAGTEPREERIPFRGKRRMAAKKMVLSKSTVPHALLVDEADATNLLSMREAIRGVAEHEGVKITVLPFIVQAVVTALRVHPDINASLDEERGEIIRKKHYDIGIAVDAEEGLVVPVIKDAGDKTIVELARDMERLSDAARTGKLSIADVSGGTFTVTSIGSIGGLWSYPVINIPEAAILGVHKIVKRPVVRDGAVVPRDMMYLSLSFDHRLIDGGAATRFMNDVIRQIENLALE